MDYKMKGADELQLNIFAFLFFLINLNTMCIFTSYRFLLFSFILGSILILGSEEKLIVHLFLFFSFVLDFIYQLVFIYHILSPTKVVPILY